MGACDEYILEVGPTNGVALVPDEPCVTVILVEPGRVGTDGVDGIDGTDGLPGPINSGFQFTQATPASTWSVTHTLGRYPLSCEIVIADQVVFSDVSYPDPLTVVVTFATPQAGILRLT